MLTAILLPVYTVLTALSSILLQRGIHTGLLLTVSTALLCCYIFESRHPSIKYCRFALLGLFHWSTQLNWVIPLYLLLLGQDAYSVKKWTGRALLLTAYGAMYTMIRLTYSPASIYNRLVIVYDLAAFFVATFLSKYWFDSEAKKRKLNTENEMLSTHDPLTGLINYEEYRRRIEAQLTRRTPFVLVLIDCTDLKPLHAAEGCDEDNRRLKKIAERLKIAFPCASTIARYGRDEFALAIDVQCDEEPVERLKRRLDSEIPRLTGVQWTYGYAFYPADGNTWEQLLHAAETMMFMMKRDYWLEREHHIARSEKLRIVGELASGMAHEIRNPLTTIKGFLQLSRTNGYNIKPWYDLIMDEINRMSELTAEFLAFSKPHAAQMKVLPLHACVQRVVSLMESEAIRLGHQLLYEANDAELEVRMDQDKLIQLLLNLVKNAFEAMPEQGKVTIRLTGNGHDAVIEVEDTGKGISKSDMEKIFHPFYTTKEHGTGLGLSICHKIVQDHGGMIEVESVPDQGTTFRITLPLAERAKPGAPA